MSSEINSFEQFNLSLPLLQGLREIGYEKPSSIQAASIPPLLSGSDLVGQAQTGTGKTAAFALPALNRLDIDENRVQVLVLTPTRELAIQVAEAFQTFAHILPGFHVLPVYGGQNMDTQLRRLKRGVHVVVGTPGRVMDHLRRGSLKLESLRTLVLDEADEMLRMGFIEDVEWILEHTPEQRQTALFSATMPREIRKVASRYLRDPVEVTIKTGKATVDTIKQVYWCVQDGQKLDALTRILEVEEVDAAIVFVRTKILTSKLAEKLKARGYSCAALNGDISQVLRERTVEQLKKKNLDIIVATDVAARGLDVRRVSHVVNYDIPVDVEAYVHRIGRTGRAGRTGTAILFATPREMRMLKTIEKVTGQKIEQMKMPSAQTITELRVSQFKEQLQQVIAGEELEFFQSIIDQLQEEQNISLQKIAAALTYLVQLDRPLQVSGKPGSSPQTAKEKRKKPRVHSEQGDIPMAQYRLAVGLVDQISAADIVGALSNEGGISADLIGHIKLFDEYSTVNLPKNIPKEIFQRLKKIRVRRRQLGISRLSQKGKERKAQSKPRSKSKRTADKKTKPEQIE